MRVNHPSLLNNTVSTKRAISQKNCIWYWWSPLPDHLGRLSSLFEMAAHIKSKADEQPASFRAKYFTVIGGNTKRFFQMAIFSPKKVRSDTFIGFFFKRFGLRLGSLGFTERSFPFYRWVRWKKMNQLSCARHLVSPPIVSVSILQLKSGKKSWQTLYRSRCRDVKKHLQLLFFHLLGKENRDIVFKYNLKDCEHEWGRLQEKKSV